MDMKKFPFHTARRVIPCLVWLPIFLFFLTCKGTGEEKGEIDGRRAFALLKKQCSLGYRVPGTPASLRCADFIERELENQGILVKRQVFEVNSRLLQKKVTGINIIGEYRGDDPTSDVVALSAHWDTRPIAEKDPDPAMRRKPIIGANDGASGVALLLEIARVMKKRRYPGRLLFLFFDLEDSGIPGTYEEWCLGSKHFARTSLDSYPITAGINFDMIGDRKLNVRPEYLSCRLAPDMTKAFWEFAEKRAPFQFSSQPLDFAIQDDHEPFLRKGIPYINLIDFDYPPWHTQEDTPDKCSPISLQIVGNITVEYLFQRLKNLKNNP